MMNVELPFFLVMASLVSRWIFASDKPAWVLWGVALASATWTGLVTPIGLGVCVALAVFALSGPWDSTRWAAGVYTAIALLIFGHFIPGFKSYTLFTDRILSPGAYPTSLVWNIDKALIALWILGYAFKPARDFHSWKTIVSSALPLLAGCVILIACVGVAVGALGWAPKGDRWVLYFALGNLFFVSLAEEALFRGVIQRELAHYFSDSEGAAWKSVGIGAFIFGVCHFAGGAGLILTSMVAGVFYGLAYQRTGRLEAAVLVHFGLNLIHFAFFSYPALVYQG